VLLNDGDHFEIDVDPASVGGSAESNLPEFGKESPEFMERKVFDFIVIGQFVYLALVAGFDVAQHFEIAKTCAVFEDGCEDHIGFVEGKIANKRVHSFSLEFEVVDQHKFGVKYAYDIGCAFQQVVSFFARHVDDLLDAVSRTGIDDIGYLVFVADF
jgi:hypothetical protein